MTSALRTYAELRVRCVDIWMDATRPHWREELPDAVERMRIEAWDRVKPFVDALIAEAANEQPR